VTLIKQLSDGNSEPQLDWHYLSSLLRVTKNVRKEVLLCYVFVPQTLEKNALNSPECIQQFTIELFHFNRWIPSKGIDTIMI